MSGPVVIDLPYPPSANRLHGNRKGGGKYVLPEVRAWRKEAWAHIAMQKPEKITGPYRFRLLAHKPDNRRRDRDNLVKEPLDAVVRAGIVPDDHKAIPDGADWCQAVPKGFCRVILTPVEA